MRRTPPLLALLVALLPAPAEASFLGRPIDHWLKELKSPRADRRRSAAFALGRMGGAASAAVPDLVAALKADGDPAVRDMAASAIGDIALGIDLYKPDAAWASASPSLLAAQADADPRVRRSAAYALGAFGDLARPAGAGLRGALKDRDPAVRQNAAWALGRLGPALGKSAVADLCDRLADSHVLVKRDAATALGQLGKSGGRDALREAAGPLLDLVRARDEDAVVRKAGLEALALVASAQHRKDAAPLYPLLDSKDPALARGAAYALGNMGGEPARKALPVLRRALADPDDTVKALAAATLANAGDEATGAVDDLAAALREGKDPATRRNCAIALAQLGEAARPAVKALVEAMTPVKGLPPHVASSKPYEEVRLKAAEALAKVRYPANRDAIPALREHIRHDPNPQLRHHAVWALFGLRDAEKLDDYKLRDPLLRVLDEKAGEVVELRYDTARLLASLLQKRAPDKVVDVLLEMLKKKDLRIFLGTGAAIEGTGNEAGGGKSSATEKQGGDARYLAAEALGWLGDKATKDDKVVAALRDAARDDEPRLKEAARKTLTDLGLKDD